MKRSRTSRVLVAIALATLLAPAGGAGQDLKELRRRAPAPPGFGLVQDEGGEWHEPTPADALQAMRDPDVRNPRAVAAAVLRQVYEPRAPAELDALANALADILLSSEPRSGSDEWDVHSEIRRTLEYTASPSDDSPGTPHPGSFDALVRVWETRAARALAGGGTDPLLETDRAARADGRVAGDDYAYLLIALDAIFRADPTGRGGDYLLALVEASEPPEPHEYDRPSPVLWCEVAHQLRGDSSWAILPGGRMAELPDIARVDQSFLTRCNRLGDRRIFSN